MFTQLIISTGLRQAKSNCKSNSVENVYIRQNSLTNYSCVSEHANTNS